MIIAGVGLSAPSQLHSFALTTSCYIEGAGCPVLLLEPHSSTLPHLSPSMWPQPSKSCSPQACSQGTQGRGDVTLTHTGQGAAFWGRLRQKHWNPVLFLMQMPGPASAFVSGDKSFSSRDAPETVFSIECRDTRGTSLESSPGLPGLNLHLI